MAAFSLAGLTAPAAAAVTSANPADGYGELYADFTTDDALFAYVTSDTRGGRVCVIAADVEGNCENPVFGTSNVIVGIGTSYTLIEGPDLPMGNYRLRAESPAFGDEGWTPSYTSDVFTVGPCVEDCELQIGRAQADAFKASSAEMTEAARVACSAFEVQGMAEEVKDKVEDIEEGDLKGFELPESLPESRSLDTGGRIAAVVGGVGMLFLDLGPNQGASLALEIAQRMSCQVSKMHEDIADDPPDPTLHEVAAPEFLDVPVTGVAELDTLNAALDRQAAHGIAARIAYERYQGAVAAEDLAAQRLQAGAAAAQARGLVTELRTTAEAMRELAAAAPGIEEMAGPVVASAAHLAELSTTSQRVRTSGLSPDEEQQLRDLGLDEGAIAAVIAWLSISPEGITPGDTLADVLRDTAEVFETQSAGTDAFARAASAVATTDLAPPTAGIEHIGIGSDTYRFTATGASLDGDPVEHHWDFGDGTTAVGDVVEHHFTTEGLFSVSVTTTEATAWGSSTTARLDGAVHVVHNFPPDAIADYLDLAAGATATIDVLTNDRDSDGDELAVVDITAATGGTVACEPDGLCTYRADAGLVGTENLRYTVSDGTSTATGWLHVTIHDVAVPVAQDHALTVPRGTTIDVPLPAHDPFPGPQVLEVQIVDAPALVQVAPRYPTGVRIFVPHDAAPGADTFTYRVTDGAQTSAAATVTVTIVAENRPVTAQDIAVTTPAGTPVTITLAGEDPDGLPVEYGYDRPSLGYLSGTAPTLAFDPDNLSPGTVTSFDYVARDGMSEARATVTITIGPYPGGPIVDLGPDMDVVEGNIYFTGTTARDPQGGDLEHLWDFGDGRTSTAAYPVLLFDDGGYDITLTVTDSLGRSASDTVRLTVRNLPPRMQQIGVGNDRVAGITTYLAAGAQDPGGDPLTYRWDFGDGTILESDSGVQEHVYAEAGTYRVQVVATDDAGASASTATDVEIGPLFASAGPDQVVPEGSWVTLDGAASFARGGTVEWMWDLDDGTTLDSVDTVTHRWIGDEPRTVRLTMTYADTSITGEATVSLTNLPPILGPAVPLVVEAGAPSAMLAGAVDPGTDPLTISWDLGDGTTAHDQRVVHTWTEPGDYPVTITARDDEGATGTAVVIVTVVPPGSLGPPTVDSRGRSFHLAFDRNASFADAHQYLVITGEADTTGTVSVPGLGFRANFAIAAGRTATVRLPEDVVPPELGFSGAATTRVDPAAVVVQARHEVSVYGVNRQQYSTDAFLALPDDIAGAATRAVSWEFGNGRGQVDVVPLEPDTTVRVGDGVVERTVQPGEVLRVSSRDLNDDVTGHPVTADKPVQVLSGHECQMVQREWCDHLVEAVWPTAMWGQHFLTVPLATRDGDSYRVIADRDDTEVRIDGELVATLAAGRWHQFVGHHSAEITTTGPAMVAQYANGTEFDGVQGDPFQMLVPPYEQWLDRYTVASVPGMSRDFLNLVIRGDAQGSVRVDGAPVAPEHWQPVGESGYVGAQVPVDDGEHRLTADRPFAVFAYGFGDTDSYGYPGGLALAPVAEVAQVSLTPAGGQRQVGALDCPVASVTDAEGGPLAGVRVDLEVSGANPGSLHGFTAADGTVSLCNTGTEAGRDELTASVGTRTAEASRTWVAQVEPGNAAPVATDVAVTTVAGTAVEVALAATDDDDDPLTFVIVSPPAAGSLGEVLGDRVVYTPAPGFSGTDSFTFAASDGTTTSAPATVTVTVTAAPAVPARIAIEPATRTVTVGSQDCTVLTVRDSAGEPMPGVAVSITVNGANTAAASLTTGSDGTVEFCYTGAAAGEDTIVATAGAAAAEATRHWEPVLEPPVVEILTGPDPLVAQRTATVTFAADQDEVSFRCALDGGEPVDCTSPWELSDLADGPHVLAVVATGPGGASEPAEHRWVVDTAAPVVEIVSGPSDSTSTTALVVFEATDPDAPAGSPPLTITCVLDGAAPVPCDGQWALTDLAVGPHEVVVVATDAAGNVGSAGHAWMVEAAPEEPTPNPTPTPSPGPTPTPTPTPSPSPSPVPSGTTTTPPAAPLPGDGLSTTGAPVGGLAALSGLALAAGLLLLAARRRTAS